MDERLRGGEWFELRRQVLDRDDNRCRNCGARSNLCIHHIVPVTEGGNETTSNLVALCRECHLRAHRERKQTVGDPSITATRSVFTVEEIAAVCQASAHPLHGAILTTLAKTGLGVGELCNLVIDDIDVEFLPDRKWNQAEDSFVRVRYGGDIPFNNRRERITTTYIPIDEELSQVLKKWLLVRPDTFGSDPMFCSVSEWGNRLTPSMTRSILKENSKGDRIGQLTPLDFRRFFEESFRGPPPVRGYILQGGDVEHSMDELNTIYRDSVFSLY